MSGALSLAARRAGLFGQRMTVRNMSAETQQLEGARKGDSVPAMVGIVGFLGIAVLGLPVLLMVTREKPKDAN
eukprot:gene17431-19175_t